jgi:hypothetical protein
MTAAKPDIDAVERYLLGLQDHICDAGRRLSPRTDGPEPKAVVASRVCWPTGQFSRKRALTTPV